MVEPLIECRALTKKFEGKSKRIVAVDGVDLKIVRNEMVIIRGRSGAGKSTLLNLMAGLLKPSSGSVKVGQNDLTSLPNHELSRLLSDEIGIIFQSFNLLPTYNVYENIEVSLVPKGIDRDGIRKTRPGPFSPILRPRRKITRRWYSGTIRIAVASKTIPMTPIAATAQIKIVGSM